jgi:hypothetical protein
MSIRATIRGLICALAGFLAAPIMAQEHGGPDVAERVWLNAHNLEREQFGSAPLRWNSQLADHARRWAEFLARENTLRHSPIDHRGETGENLWMGTAGGFGPGDMIESFVREKRHFTPGTFPRVSSTGNWADVGHYTQVVWAQTREVGCASARGSGYDVLVCRYWPAGNVIGTKIAPYSPIARR